jgi:uncharacterized protein
MLLMNLYYQLRPFVPRAVQIAIRRQIVRHRLPRFADVWPIDERAGVAPEGWSGWPDGKKFAFVITHDVETAKGVGRCLQLARIDREHGFRSSFNFVAEGYPIPEGLKENLVADGFEIGVHGLVHRGNLYGSRKKFEQDAAKINQYLKEWKTGGFRTPSMFHNLEWVHHLDIEYDSSTFDTDPFEPQPDALGTIFPKWISANGNGRGFLELPYTLPQDYMLFVIMRETSIDIWKRKLDWIAERGGMAMLLVHPDYMSFNGPDNREYPLNYYTEFLHHVESRYAGQYWHALPRDVSQFWSKFVKQPSAISHQPSASSIPHTLYPTPPGLSETLHPTPHTRASGSNGSRGRIWIDLDNTPHVPLFNPVIRELRNHSYEVVTTARDCAQTCGLADLFRLDYQRIGRHYGKNRLMKVGGTVLRAMQLARVLSKQGISLAVSHGSRAQMLAAVLMKVPSLVMMDYEHVKGMIKPGWVMIPEVINGASLPGSKDRILRYPGIKEDLYVPEFRPDPTIKGQLGLSESDIVVTIRPPANEAHYHNPESEALFLGAVNRLGSVENARMVILPRNEGQISLIQNVWKEWCANRKIVIPEKVVDGLNLLWHSDFAISGGGTMNREAAALEVPVYSIFRGKIGDVDRYLSSTGRLVLLESLEDVQNKLMIIKRKRVDGAKMGNKGVLQAVISGVINAAEASVR